MSSELIYYSTVFFIFLGYSLQIYKLLKQKDSHGLSLHAYVITFIALLFLYFKAESTYVIYVVYAEALILSLVILFAILFDKTSSVFNENKTDFSISFLLSVFYITGVSQAIKSFKNKTYISNVSIGAYLSWYFFKLGLIVMAENPEVIIAVLITLVVYTFIIIDTLIKNFKTQREEIKYNDG